MQNIPELELIAETITAVTRFNLLLERMSQQDFYRLPDINVTYLPHYYFVWIANSKGKLFIDTARGLIPANLPGAEEKALELAKKYNEQGKTVEISLRGKVIKKFKGKVKEKVEKEDPSLTNNPSGEEQKTFSKVEPVAVPATDAPKAVNQPAMA